MPGDGRIAFASCRFQPGAIFDGYRTARVADQARFCSEPASHRHAARRVPNICARNSCVSATTLPPTAVCSSTASVPAAGLRRATDCTPPPGRLHDISCECCCNFSPAPAFPQKSHQVFGADPERAAGDLHDHPCRTALEAATSGTPQAFRPRQSHLHAFPPASTISTEAHPPFMK